MSARILVPSMLALADVAIVVSDAKASARWWESKVGFATHTMGGTGHAVLVAPPGDRLVLHLCEAFEPVSPGNTGVAFITDDIDPLVSRMVSGGVQFPEPLHAEKWGKSAKFADPDGNIFWLLEVPAAMVRSTLRLRAPGGGRSGGRTKRRATGKPRGAPPGRARRRGR